MSEGKWLIFNSHIIDKVEEITEKLESDIKKEKETNSEDRYSSDYPWGCLLEQIKKIGINHKRDYVETNRMFYEEYELDIVQYTKKHFPQWVGIFDETDVEKDKRKMDEFMKSIE
jgi:hypothetical protein